MLAKLFSFWASSPGRLAPPLILSLFLVPLARPQTAPNDLTQMNIEDLMNVEVTSVSRHQQSLSKTAAAIFVITEEDIQRSGATNIPDLLRMVPGVQVAQINASNWAISIRGFNGRFSNKVLVMVDGRTVYVPSFGGVFYEVLDVPLEQIAQIEVIRGPGGSVWGTNAVNGVINILTKKASATLGTTIVAGIGTNNRASALLQQGGKARGLGDFRVFAEYSTEGSLPGSNGAVAEDGWNILHGGFLTDSQISAKDSLSIQGDLYTGGEGISTPYHLSSLQDIAANTFRQVHFSGGFFQASWGHRFSGRSDTTLLVSYQRAARSDVLRENRGMLDIDFQHNLSIGERHQFVWGFDYRHSDSQTEPTFAVSMVPPDHHTDLYSGFAQDQIVLLRDRLFFTLGAKFEHHSYTGFSVMPSARVAWTPSPKSTLWAAISRAVRVPSETETSVRVIVSVFPGAAGVPVEVLNLGNPQLQNESLLAYEAGYRKLLRQNFSVDLTAYYNNYDNLVTAEPAAPYFENTPAPAHLVMPLIGANTMYGESHGLEAFANWQVLPRWTLSPGYAFERIHLHLDPGSHDGESIAFALEGTPVNSAQLRSHVALPRQFSWDTSAYFVDRLPTTSVASYTRLDTGLTWQWKEHLTLSVFGQNLLQDNHMEFQDFTRSINSSLIPRGAYAKLTWHF